MKDRYSKILKWAHNKQIFSEKELFNKFNLNNELDRKWFVDVFKGAINNDDCIIKHYEYKNGEHYYCLSAKGISAYQKLIKNWYEKPLGIIVITIIAGVIIGGIMFWLRWN